MDSRWKPGDQPNLEDLEREAAEERDAFEEEHLTEVEQSRLAVLSAKGGTKRGLEYSVPKEGSKSRCSRCDRPIAWRQYGGKPIPLDLDSVLEDRFGERFARDHRGLCCKDRGGV